LPSIALKSKRYNG